MVRRSVLTTELQGVKSQLASIQVASPVQEPRERELENEGENEGENAKINTARLRTAGENAMKEVSYVS